MLSNGKITSLVATGPALIAKSSLVWPSIVATLGDKQIREKLFCFKRQINTHSTRSNVSLNKLIRLYFH